jgi:hypothetical protein
MRTYEILVITDLNRAEVLDRLESALGHEGTIAFPSPEQVELTESIPAKVARPDFGRSARRDRKDQKRRPTDRNRQLSDQDLN